jgi:hypothetical protein
VSSAPGNVGFVFCIVDHPAIFEERSYAREKTSSPSKLVAEHSAVPGYDDATMQRLKNEDLSSKLTSILSVLSSESRICDESSSSTSHSASTIKPNHAAEDKEVETEEYKSLLGNGNISNEEEISWISSSSSSVFPDFYSSENNENPDKREQ